ncbi:lipoprotein, partial [Pseudomonas syringae pv. actinidiae ICMP 18804]
MKLIGIFVLILSLTGCSSMLFYPEHGLPFTPDKARLQYQDVNLTAADGT